MSNRTADPADAERLTAATRRLVDLVRRTQASGETDVAASFHALRTSTNPKSRAALHTPGLITSGSAKTLVTACFRLASTRTW